jgi:O-antigen/teichoic acid export membrane protein
MSIATRPSRASLAGYYVAMGSAGVLGLLKGLLYARILGSEEMGFYSLYTLIASYGAYVCTLGLYRGLDCVLPAQYGAGADREADRIRNGAAGVILILSLAFLLLFSAGSGILLPARFRRPSMAPVAASLTVTTVLFGLAVQELRSRKKTLAMALIVCVKSVLVVGLAPLLALWYGSVGILFMESLISLLVFAFAAKVTCRDFRFTVVRMHELKPLLMVGVPLTLNYFVTDLLLSLDRWCVASTFGIVSLGQYSFALLLVSGGEIVRNTVWSHIGPHAANQFGVDRDAKAFMNRLHRLSLALILMFIAGWLPFRYAVHQIIPHYFKEYLQSGELMSVLYWGVCIQVLDQYEWVPMTFLKTGRLLFLTVLVACATGVLFAVAIAWAWPLAAFAWIYVSGRALLAAGHIVLAVLISRSSVKPSPAGFDAR